MNLRELGIRWRTLRHVKTSQLLWRLWRQLEVRRPLTPARAERWRWQGAGLPPVRNDFPDIPLPHGADTDLPQVIAQLARGVFHHLNLAKDLGLERPDWHLHDVAVDRLWTITLHYHAWAFALARQAAVPSETSAAEAARLFRHYLQDWIRRCALHEPGAIALAWNPYAIATRMSWWIRSYRLLGPAYWGANRDFHRAFLESLWQQAAYLSDHLEWDLRANHLLRDTVGLAWAGRFFAHARADEWLRRATRVAVAQTREQVLPDGGHFERSPLYHIDVMLDFVALALLARGERERSIFRETWARLAAYLRWVRHPDGQIPLLNDAALDSGPSPKAVLELGAAWGYRIDAALPTGGCHFGDTGLVVWHGAPWTLFFDVGPVGPNCQPGHAHADTLTIECSYKNQRLFVDPGTHSYDNDERRRYDRSTAAHNTVLIDDTDSSEVWHNFRVGQRAWPGRVRVIFSRKGMCAGASHNGYNNRAGQPQHSRAIRLSDGGCLTITDRIHGTGRHTLCGGFLLAPQWTATRHEPGWKISHGDRRLHVSFASSHGLELEEQERPYHPEYGREVTTKRLGWRIVGSLPVEVTLLAEGN